MSLKPIKIQKNEHIGTILMNRPEIMNALSIEMVEEFIWGLDHLATDNEIRVVVLEGAGGNFCTGSSMSNFSAGYSTSWWYDVMKKIGQIVSIMREMPQPIISKVSGMAIGGGANIALAGDFVIASDNAVFREVFVNHGLVLDCGGTFHLPRLVGLVKARELALLGERFDGKTAASIGLIYKSVPAEAIDDEVYSLAQKLSKKPPASMNLIKKSLDRSYEMSLREDLEWEAANQVIRLQSDDVKEAARKFIESKKNNRSS